MLGIENHFLTSLSAEPWEMWRCMMSDELTVADTIQGSAPGNITQHLWKEGGERLQ